MSRNKSILLQVAFKEAASNADDIDAVEKLTGDYYNVLVGLHDKLGLSLEEEARPSRFPAKTTTAKKPAASEDDAPIVTIQGEDYFDYRGIKEVGGKPERWPDFKKVGDKTNKGSEWLIDRDGVTPTAFAKLVASEGV